MARYLALMSTVRLHWSIRAWRAYTRHIAIALLCTLFVCAGFAQSSSADACLPSSSGVRICLPEAAAKVGSVVTIIAGAAARSGDIVAIRAYIDTVAVFTVDNPSFTSSFQVAQDVNVNAGSHHLVIVGYENDGGSVVGGASFNSETPSFAECIPSEAGAEFCHPGTASAIASPIQISAGARAVTGHITAIRLYVDDEPQLTVNNPDSTPTFAINEPLALPNNLDPSTAHNITLVGYESTGGAVTAFHTLPQQVEFTAPEICQAPGSPGVNVCSPQPNSCTTSGLYFIRATGTGESGPVARMELWANAVKIADFPGNSINTNIGPPLLGSDVTLTIVVVDVNGHIVKSAPIAVFAC